MIGRKKKKKRFSSKKNMSIVTFHAPPKLIELMDKIVKELNYPNRSEFMREAVRFYIYTILSNKLGLLKIEKNKIVFNTFKVKREKPIIVF